MRDRSFTSVGLVFLLPLSFGCSRGGLRRSADGAVDAGRGAEGGDVAADVSGPAGTGGGGEGGRAGSTGGSAGSRGTGGSGGSDNNGGTAGRAGTDAGADGGTAGGGGTDAGTDGPPCDARITFDWVIEDNVTGAPRTCASAGAAQFVAIVNRMSRAFPCPAGSSSGSFDVEFGTSGAYDVQLELVDSNNVILSATQTSRVNVSCAKSSVPVIMDVE